MSKVKIIKISAYFHSPVIPLKVSWLRISEIQLLVLILIVWKMSEENWNMICLDTEIALKISAGRGGASCWVIVEESACSRTSVFSC